MESSNSNEIGLVVSKQIILALRGKIDFTSNYNVGTTFVFSLPMEQGQDESFEAQAGIQAEDSPRFA